MARYILLIVVCLAVICLGTNHLYAAGVSVPTGKGAADNQAGVESAPGSRRTSLRVMTFNIRWEGVDSSARFVDSGFARRKPAILDVLTQDAIDVIGLQEASREQRAMLAPGLPGFGMFPVPAEAGDECILYRLDRFDLRDGGREYLRREPEQAGTNIGVRDFVWVYLQDRISGKRFYVLNLHADYRSLERGRQLDGVLIGKWIGRRRYADPVIVIGDIAGGPQGPRLLYLTGQISYPDEHGKPASMPMPMLDTFTMENPDASYPGTDNSDFSGKKNRNQIDYILVPRGTRVIDSHIIYYNLNGLYPSDHFPLVSDFELE
jgi:endonuclease/exonuclease/phosphatase family metal-dependent hydrolase